MDAPWSDGVPAHFGGAVRRHCQRRWWKCCSAAPGRAADQSGPAEDEWAVRGRLPTRTRSGRGHRIVNPGCTPTLPRHRQGLAEHAPPTLAQNRERHGRVSAPLAAGRADKTTQSDATRKPRAKSRGQLVYVNFTAPHRAIGLRLRYGTNSASLCAVARWMNPSPGPRMAATT
jgi:hypothetical protein